MKGTKVIETTYTSSSVSLILVPWSSGDTSADPLVSLEYKSASESLLLTITSKAVASVSSSSTYFTSLSVYRSSESFEGSVEVTLFEFEDTDGTSHSMSLTYTATVTSTSSVIYQLSSVNVDGDSASSEESTAGSTYTALFSLGWTPMTVTYGSLSSTHALGAGSVVSSDTLLATTTGVSNELSITNAAACSTCTALSYTAAFYLYTCNLVLS